MADELSEQQKNLLADDGKYTAHGTPLPPEIAAWHKRMEQAEQETNSQGYDKDRTRYRYRMGDYGPNPVAQGVTINSTATPAPQWVKDWMKNTTGKGFSEFRAEAVARGEYTIATPQPEGKIHNYMQAGVDMANEQDYPGPTRVAWRDPQELAELLGDVDADIRSTEAQARADAMSSEEIQAAYEQGNAERLEDGINQVAAAIMHAEDRAELTPNVPVVETYTTNDTILRVEVLVEDERTATGYTDLDVRDANRPFIPLTWRNGGGVVQNLYPVEVHDQAGNLIGAWGARELQISYQFADPQPPTPQEIERWIQGRMVDHNKDRVAVGLPAMPVIGQDFYITDRQGLTPQSPCELCGQEIGTTDYHRVSDAGGHETEVVVWCNR